MRTHFILLAAFGCASAPTSTAERAFERVEASKVPLQSLDVIVATAPPASTDGAIDVDAFPPPRLTDLLFTRREDPVMKRALQEALRSWGEARGFAVSMLEVEGAEPRVRNALAQSRADGVLVVRAIAVDDFMVYGVRSKQVFTELSAGQFVQESAPVGSAARGRLVVGQAFLFEPETGLRLWSRQVPDFPEDGKPLADDAFLRYGFVMPADAPELSEVDRARRAAPAFVNRILEAFPGPQEGDPAALAAFSARDVDREARKDAFFDRGHVLVEVGTGWSIETLSLTPVLSQRSDTVLNPSQRIDTELPSLGAGELAPSGQLRFVQPKVSFLAPGGAVFGARFGYGRMFGDFSRAYVQEIATSSGFDQIGRIRVTGGELFSFSGSVGRAFWLDDRVLLIPEIGVSYELWSFDIDSGGLVGDSTLDRLSAELAVGLLYRFDPSGPLYVRPRGGLRAGVTLDNGEPVLGLDLGLAVGLMY